ncbi:glycosyltransferase [Paracoccus sp. (in: a-proteobacteria)]|uniref:glycosyltransferase n=1 Tax=Paracoccus sp. TaxID=267 RepID=UPI0026DF38D3|nr:glycosyltransferase [Paracoccus sp. (in: a-proteobacteria)]MDO5648817.1 glycosyltransferase [Paracoccus sp. (in: a-proteobacteria)]
MKVQMLGLCRFSYLGLRGYQVDHQTLNERRAYLYDPARLARRWQWFTQMALPAWRAQTDPDFTLVLMTGPDLPEPYLSGLRDLCDATPQLRLSVVPPMDRHLPACRAAIEPHLDPSADVIGHFRHDDDDAVTTDYVARSRQAFRRVRGLWKVQGKLSLDFSRGVMLRVQDGQAEFTPRICHNMGVALTIFLRPDADESALHYDHSKLGRWMPGVSIPEPLMFIRSIHGDSDSGDMGPGHRFDLSDDALTRQLRRFALTRGDIDRLAQTLRAG